MSMEWLETATRVKKRSVIISGHPTSVSLEDAFWDTLKWYADADGKSLNQVIAEIDADRNGNLSSAIRVYLLSRLLRERQSEDIGGQEPTAPDNPDT